MNYQILLLTLFSLVTSDNVLLNYTHFSGDEDVTHKQQDLVVDDILEISLYEQGGSTGYTWQVYVPNFNNQEDVVSYVSETTLEPNSIYPGAKKLKVFYLKARYHGQTTIQLLNSRKWLTEECISEENIF